MGKSINSNFNSNLLMKMADKIEDDLLESGLELGDYEAIDCYLLGMIMMGNMILSEIETGIAEINKKLEITH